MGSRIRSFAVRFLIIFSGLLFSFSVFSQTLEETGIDVLQLRISEMERIIAEQTDMIERFDRRLEKMQEQLDRTNADVEIRFGELDKQTASRPAPAAITSGDIKPKEIYDAGVELIRTGKYQEAQKKFEEFLTVAPQDALAGNAKYWLGESYYARGDYTSAAVIFAQGFKEYPKSVKAPDNLLKLGISMQALKKKNEACTAFTSIKKEFPKADRKILDKAAGEAKKLGCD